MPFITIGVPTYNRARYLSYTLACILQQTFEDFEVIISDNASTDDTPEVVRQFQDKRIRYVRQPTLVGPEENWLNCAALSRADWLVFNQDDDVLSPYFLERCARAIHRHPEIVMYAADCAIATDITRHHGSSICGLPFGHSWDQAQPRLIPGVQIAALAWFINCFFSPAQAIPTHLWRKHFPRGPEAVYLGDHYITSHVACEGMIAYESYQGAIIREHSSRLSNTTPDIARRRVETPFIALRAMFEEKKVDWQSALRNILPEFPLAYREWLLNQYLLNEFVAEEAMEILAAGVALGRNASPHGFLEKLRVEKRKPAPMGRLDRWNVPKPMARVIRGFLYAAGKDVA